MALPKRRHSRTRGRLRRTGDALDMPTIARCPECGAAVQPHTACKSCGAYQGKRNVIKARTQSK